MAQKKKREADLAELARQAPALIRDANRRLAEQRSAYMASAFADQSEPTAAQKKDESRCGICNHPQREGIEITAIASMTSWSETSRTINRNFNTNFDPKSIKKHMTDHRISAQVRRAGIMLADVQGEDPLLTAHGLVKVLLSQALTDVAAGRIKARNVPQVMQLIEMDRRLGGEDVVQDVDAERHEMYRQVSLIADILRSTLDQETLDSVMARAGEYNLHLAEVPELAEYEVIEDPMQQAVEDMKALGHTRTRQDLIEAGLFDEEDSEVIEEQE